MSSNVVLGQNMKWDEVSDSVCEIARGLSQVGDRWTLLIMRELGLGNHRFDEIQAQTGVSSHLLSSRLKRMEEDGLIVRKPYSEKPARYEYHATKKGQELDSVLLALRGWTMRWTRYKRGAGPACDLVHRETGETVDAVWRAPYTGKPFTFEEVDASMSPAFQKERDAKSLAFQQARARGKAARA